MVGQPGRSRPELGLDGLQRRRLPAQDGDIRSAIRAGEDVVLPARPVTVGVFDLRAVRRWFVESYYFEHANTLPDGPDQSL